MSVGVTGIALAGCGRVAQSNDARAASGGSGGALLIATAGAEAVSGAPAAGRSGSDGGTASASAGQGGTINEAGGVGGAVSGAAGVSGTAGVGGASGPSLPHPYRALQIATGRYHSCALLENHQVKCWGRNGYGQLGLGDVVWRGLDQSLMGDALPFVDLGHGRSAKSISAGRYSTCAILDDDSIKCWGLPVFELSSNFIGDEPGELSDALAPLALGIGRTAKAVAIGYYDACVALDDDSFLCGSAGVSPSHVAAAPDAHLVSMASSNAPIGVFDDGSARYMGTGAAAPTSSYASNVLLATGSRDHACFLLQGQKLQCGSSYWPALPAEVPGAVALAISELGTLCAIVAEGRVHCWSGNHRDPAWPLAAEGWVEVPLTAPAVQISSAGWEHHCALLSDGAVECWSWDTTTTDAVGFDDHASPVLMPVNLGIWPGP